MRRDLAALIVDTVVSLDKGLGALNTLIGRIDDEQERKRYMKTFGDVRDSLVRDFLRPIEREYPDLNPDRQSLDQESDTERRHNPDR